MKVLVACEESQIVCGKFRERGYKAYSCDTLDCSGRHPEWHIKDDVLNHLDEDWDLMIAHPPCTHLCVSGARWFASGHKPIKLQEDALEFVKKLLDAPIKHIALENPISVISTKIRKPEQIIRPFMFGENSTKATCLWLKNLPPLMSTKIIVPETHTTKSGRIWDKWWFETSLISDLKKRSLMRSKTFPNIAKAMALQWGEFISE